MDFIPGVRTGGSLNEIRYFSLDEGNALLPSPEKGVDRENCDLNKGLTVGSRSYGTISSLGPSMESTDAANGASYVISDWVLTRGNYETGEGRLIPLLFKGYLNRHL